MYPIALLGLISGPATLVALILALIKRPWALKLGAVPFALGVALIALGLFGYFSSMRVVESVLEIADPSEIEVMRAKGTAEARTPIIFALMLAILPLAAAALLGGVHRMRTAKTAGGAVAWIAPIALALGVTIVGIGVAEYEFAKYAGDAGRAISDPSDRSTFIARAEKDERDAGILALIGLAPLALGTILVATARRT